MLSVHLLADSYSSYFSISSIISHYPAKFLYAYKSSFIITLTRRVIYFHFTFLSFHNYLRAEIASPIPAPPGLPGLSRMPVICLLCACCISLTNKGENEILLLLLTFPHLFQKQNCIAIYKNKSQEVIYPIGNLQFFPPSGFQMQRMQLLSMN